jgi:hypothetical protein
MPASKGQAPDSKPTAFPGPANLALESEAWLSGSVKPKGPPCRLVPNLAFGSVEQPVAKALTGTAAPPPAKPGAPPAGTAAALPPPPVAALPKAKAPPPAPPVPLFRSMRDARDWWNGTCQKDDYGGRWITPVTQNMLHTVGWMDWPNMVKDERLHKGEHAMTSIMPTFYMDEADQSRFDRPRLDFVVEFDDGQAVRYHPDAKPIWLPASADNDAIDNRRRYLARMRRRTHGRDWYG